MKTAGKKMDFESDTAQIFDKDTVDSRYLDFCYLEQPLISKRKSGPCNDTEI